MSRPFTSNLNFDGRVTAEVKKQIALNEEKMKQLNEEGNRLTVENIRLLAWLHSSPHSHPARHHHNRHPIPAITFALALLFSSAAGCRAHVPSQPPSVAPRLTSLPQTNFDATASVPSVTPSVLALQTILLPALGDPAFLQKVPALAEKLLGVNVASQLNDAMVSVLAAQVASARSAVALREQQLKSQDAVRLAENSVISADRDRWRSLAVSKTESLIRWISFIAIGAGGLLMALGGFLLYTMRPSHLGAVVMAGGLAIGFLGWASLKFSTYLGLIGLVAAAFLLAFAIYVTVLYAEPKKAA